MTKQRTKADVMKFLTSVPDPEVFPTEHATWVGKIPDQALSMAERIYDVMEPVCQEFAVSPMRVMVDGTQNQRFPTQTQVETGIVKEAPVEHYGVMFEFMRETATLEVRIIGESATVRQFSLELAQNEEDKKKLFETMEAKPLNDIKQLPEMVKEFNSKFGDRYFYHSV